jgi:hypothetical protein
VESIALLVGNNMLATAKAESAPMNCATINAETSTGRMPEKVFVNERAMVMAGLANEVEAVNQ